MFLPLLRPSDFIARLLPSLSGRFLPLHSRFERSANLSVGPSLLMTITERSLGLSPFGLAVHGDLGDALQHLAHAGGLVYRNAVFRAGGRPLWELAPIPAYPTHLVPPSPRPHMSAGSFRRLLLDSLSGPQQGLAQLLTRGEPGRVFSDDDALSDWVRGAAEPIALFRRDSGQSLVEAGRRLIGLGLGLTPSGDDFLVGFTAARLAQGRLAEVRALRLGLARHAMQATNLISASYLRHGFRGRFTSHMRDLIRQLHTPGVTPAALQPAVERLIAVGSTSGSDSLVGLLTALHRYEHEEGPVPPA